MGSLLVDGGKLCTDYANGLVINVTNDAKILDWSNYASTPAGVTLNVGGHAEFNSFRGSNATRNSRLVMTGTNKAYKCRASGAHPAYVTVDGGSMYDNGSSFAWGNPGQRVLSVINGGQITGGTFRCQHLVVDGTSSLTGNTKIHYRPTSVGDNDTGGGI